MMNVCLGNWVTACFLWGVLWGTPGGLRAGTITAKGSDTVMLLARNWAKVYMEAHPTIRVEVIGGGSGIGFAALQNRTTDLTHASRQIKPQELEACVKAFGRQPLEYRVGLDGLTVCVNARNPVRELSLDQLRDLYTGRITRWDQVGGEPAPVVLYGRENSSGSYEFFKERVLRGQDYSARMQVAPGSLAVAQSVALDRYAIGFGGRPEASGVAAVALRAAAGERAVLPSAATIADGSYPIWRPLYVYVNPALYRGDIAAYLAWIRGAEGQRVVRDSGYYPLPAGGAP